jgi:purine-binding chemotaxis protein CheW
MAAMTEAQRGAGAAGGKFLTFSLAGEEYGLEILKVREIIGLASPGAITRVPRTPPFIRGVINVRGKIIPLLDLRLKFGMDPAEHTAETCAIIVQPAGLEVGLVVDRVLEVLDIPAGAIGDTPAFGAGFDTEYLLGVALAGDRVRLLLNIEKVLSTPEMITLHSMGRHEDEEGDGTNER